MPDIDPVLAQRLTKAPLTSPLGVTATEISAAQARLKSELGGTTNLSFLDKLLQSVSSPDALKTMKVAQDAVYKVASEISQVSDPTADLMQGTCHLPFPSLLALVLIVIPR